VIVSVSAAALFAEAPLGVTVTPPTVIATVLKTTSEAQATTTDVSEPAKATRKIPI